MLVAIQTALCQAMPEFKVGLDGYVDPEDGTFLLTFIVEAGDLRRDAWTRIHEISPSLNRDLPSGVHLGIGAVRHR